MKYQVDIDISFVICIGNNVHSTDNSVAFDSTPASFNAIHSYNPESNDDNCFMNNVSLFPMI